LGYSPADIANLTAAGVLTQDPRVAQLGAERQIE
jgi:hypothetical protein